MSDLYFVISACAGIAMGLVFALLGYGAVVDVTAADLRSRVPVRSFKGKPYYPWMKPYYLAAACTFLVPVGWLFGHAINDSQVTGFVAASAAIASYVVGTALFKRHFTRKYQHLVAG